MKGYSAVGFFLPIWIALHFSIAAFLVHILSFQLAILTLIKLNMGLYAPPIPLGKKTYKVNIFVNVCVMWGNYINWFLFVCIYCPGIPWIIIFYKYRDQYIDFTKRYFGAFFLHLLYYLVFIATLMVSPRDHFLSIYCVLPEKPFILKQLEKAASKNCRFLYRISLEGDKGKT